MTAELVRGQNHPLPEVRLEVRVSAGKPIVAGATLSDEHGKVHAVEWVAHPGAPTLPGLEVSRQAAADHRLAFDLGALPEAVHRVSVLLALTSGDGGGPNRFGTVAAPFVAVTDLDGTEVASYTITGLDSESAVVALELYRRQGSWKVRAVGQGYAGGLAEFLTDQGLPQAQQLAGSINEVVDQGLARSVAAPRPGRPAPTAPDTPPHPRWARTSPTAAPHPRAPRGTRRRSRTPTARTPRARPVPLRGDRRAGRHVAVRRLRPGGRHAPRPHYNTPSGPHPGGPVHRHAAHRTRRRRPRQLHPPPPADRGASADRAPGPAGTARAARRR